MTNKELLASYAARRHAPKAEPDLAKGLEFARALAMDVLPALTPEQERQADAAEALPGPREARAVALRMLAFGVDQIAKEMGESEETIQRWLMIARRKGSLAEVGDMLQYQAAAMATDGLLTHLAVKDKEMIVETLKGLGYFRSYNQVRNEGAAAEVTHLHVSVEMPAGVRAGANTPLLGQIVGQPRVLDVTPVNEEEE